MKRFLRITQEAVLGTYNSGGTAIHVRLDSPKAFQVMTKPQFYEIMSGNGFANLALTGSAVTGLGATLSIPMFYSQFLFLMGWSATRINSGQTSPWTTSEAVGDLPSCTIDYGYSNFEGTIRRKRFLGCKVGSAGLSGNQANPHMRGTFAIVACTPQGNSFDASSDPSSVVFPEPADTAFPTDSMLFQHLRSGFTLASSRTNFESVSISIANRLKAYFDESRFANAIRIGGRRLSASTSLRLKATPDDRAAFEAATLQALSFVFTNGTNTATIDCKSKNRIDGLDESFPLDEEIYYDLSLSNLLDTAVPGDFTIAYA